MGYITHYVEDDSGYELEVSLEYSYHHQAAYISGAPENCYPEEEEFEFWLEEDDHKRYSALEWWTMNNIDEDDVFDAVVEDANNSAIDAAESYYDGLRDEELGL